MKWFRFWDMYSGGYSKTDYSTIYVKAETEDKAIGIFESKTGLDAYNVTCDCCGNDFAIDEITEDMVEIDETTLVLGE